MDLASYVLGISRRQVAYYASGENPIERRRPGLPQLRCNENGAR